MLIHRCPWCGERLPFSSTSHNQYKNGSLRCPKCNNICVAYSKKSQGNGRNRTKISKIILILMLFLWIPFRAPFSIVKWWQNPFLCITVYLFFGITLLWIWYIPYDRDTAQKNQKEQIRPETYKAHVFISWESHKNEGFLCPKLQVPNGEIFPACFMDVNGQPISTALCVVLENIHWENPRRCTCTIQIVLDTVSSKNLFQKGNMFNLYHNYRLIAKGTLQ